MKRIFCCSIMLLSVTPLLRGQGTPTAAEVASRQEAEEKYNSLSGHIDDLMAAQAAQEKRLQALAKEIADLRDQAAKPTGNYASQDDLKHLADAIQEIDKKREADKELILNEIAKIGKAIGASTARVSPKPSVSNDGDHTAAPALDPNANGYYYVLKKGENYSIIAQAYREQGIKVTSDQIEKANPGLDPTKLKVGQKIFIPAPAK